MRRVLLLTIAVLMVGAVGVASGTKLVGFKPARVGNTLRAPKRFEGHKVRRYQWQRCGRHGRSCKKVHGATHRTYRVRKVDVGYTFRVQLTVATAAGTVTVESAPTAVITAAAPVNLTLPTVSGTTTQGQVLTGTAGTWQNATSFTYQWEDCDTTGANCVAISGATATTYTLQASDVGHTIRLAVTATNGASASSSAV